MITRALKKLKNLSNVTLRFYAQKGPFLSDGSDKTPSIPSLLLFCGGRPYHLNKMSDPPKKPLSKRALKRIARAEKNKEFRRKKKEENLKFTQRDDAGYSIADFDQSSYFFEKGLRKVYPYNYVFTTHAKGRWIGRTLHEVLAKEFGYDSPDQLNNSFENGKIHVNNHKVSQDYVIKDCDYISHRTHRHENPVTSAPIEIIKDTDDLIVINKPSSVPCHPCGRYRFNSIVFILGKDMGYTNLRNIYRLDRLTSGVLILGKTVQMTKTLEDQVVNRQVQKEYVCRVVGKFPDGQIKVDQPLAALSNKLRLQIVSSKGKPSQTTFERLSYNGKSSVVRCIPHTGRTHQIRVHLQFLGHPIINDGFYNNEAWGSNKGMGAEYQVPHEKVCERILKEHHATLWDGEENPLYKEKQLEVLRKDSTQDTNENSAYSFNHNEKIQGTALSVSSHPPSSLSKSVSSNSASIHTGTTPEEPPCKKLKTEESDILTDQNRRDRKEESIQNSDSSIKELDSCERSETHVKTSEIETLKNDHSVDADFISSNVRNNSGSRVADITAGAEFIDLSNTDDKSLLSSHKNGRQEADLSCSKEKAGDSNINEVREKGAGDTRPGFDPAKWSVDLTCEMCKKTTIDPQEKDLVMFLHALKYKGPGWEYETSLPDWARADWNREDDYVFGNLKCPASLDSS